MMVGNWWWGRHGPDGSAVEIKFRWSASLSLMVSSGVGASAGCDETRFWCDLLALSLSLSLSSIFLGWKSFEGKIKPENEFQVRKGILQSTWKMNSVWPNFLELPNTHVYGKTFPKMVWSQNKHSLSFPLEPIKIHPSKLGGKNVVYIEFTILAILIRDLNL